MIDTLPQTSSIALDAVYPYSDTLDTLQSPSPVRQGKTCVSRHAYSVRQDVVVEAMPLHESAVGSQFTGDFAAAARQLARLLAMPPDWDSYGASPIDRQKAGAALYLVWIAIVSGAPVPAIVPTSDGGIQLEWHRRGVDLEIRVISGASFEVFFEELATGKVCEGEIGTDLAPLLDFLERVTG